MTVCAWDGRILAVDTFTFLGDHVADSNANKLHRVDHRDIGPCVAAVAGTTIHTKPWMDHIGRSGFDGFNADLDLSAIFVSRHGEAYECIPDGGFNAVTGYTAIGIGQLLATAALRDGADAIEAVRYAIRHHVYCGGTIRAYDWQSNVIVRIKE